MNADDVHNWGHPGEWEDVYVGVDTEAEVKGLEPGVGRTYRVIAVNMENYKSQPSVSTVAATLLPRMPVPKLVCQLDSRIEHSLIYHSMFLSFSFVTLSAQHPPQYRRRANLFLRVP